MTQSAKVTGATQKLTLDAIVELIEIDIDGFSEPVYITPGPLNGAPVKFGGKIYHPVPLESRGWETNGQGQMPRPIVRVANTNNLFSGLVQNFDDLVGSEVRRVRTLARFLDGQPDADPNATFPVDVFRVERKLTQNKLLVELELTAAFDQEDRKLPGRQVIRNTCTQRYRAYSTATGTFNYDRATCPYFGSKYFNISGAPVSDPSLDRCGKRLSDCKLRFGNNATLPTRAFPGTGKY
ncbi:phage minor tail protein L [Roseibium aggregatum]|uniref:Phage minor tail protein L n=1 Tax=Roseibium aggregatum TaxID=187304 RepID=A0A0M6Y7T1_9HYPH|nr:phage minor tail protein L [Roseibium aggregatum]CTQ45774.1 phage minor tail protein L [Roseibium aggregatum]